jgi:hypothetical protein
MLKLQERKVITKQGLEELRNFLNSFKFEDDIKDMDSEITFFARLDIMDDNSPAKYQNCNCKFVLKNSQLFINTGVYEHEGMNFVSISSNIKRISFLDCLASFTSLLTKYNAAVIEKEKAITEFLDFMQAWKNQNKI